MLFCGFVYFIIIWLVVVLCLRVGVVKDEVYIIELSLDLKVVSKNLSKLIFCVSLGVLLWNLLIRLVLIESSRRGVRFCSMFGDC